MTDAPDTELLAQFTRENSETAFAALVERHIGLVHSVALRHATNPQHAQDITQAVFIILARKAATLNQKTILPGWLYNTARLTAANFQRAEASRIRREQEAFMQSTLQETAPDELWREMSPLLDEAMLRLGATDRDALVLRYFQNKTLPEVGAALGLEERAAQKRVTRAVEKLRKIFIKHGVTLTATAIAGTVSANSVQAAPVGLVKIISAVAVAKGAMATASTLTLVKGALNLMAWTKAKITVVSVVAVLLVGGATTITVKQLRERIRLKAESEYHGQPVTYWLDQVFLGFPKSSAQETYAALRQLGAPAAAPLVQALTLTNSPPGSPFTDFHDIRQNVFSALEEMGPAAKSQVPELIQLLQHPDMKVRVFATATLADIGPEAQAAIPALMEESQDLTNGITQPSGVHSREVFTPLAPYAQEALRRIERK